MSKIQDEEHKPLPQIETLYLHSSTVMIQEQLYIVPKGLRNLRLSSCLHGLTIYLES